jgi:hypothetical protein
MSVPTDPVDPDPRLPTVEDIGAILRARTQDIHDDEIGTFNDETRPTAVDVERLILIASGNVYGRTGDMSGLECEDADTLRETAKGNVAILAAMLVELSFFPEQVQSNRSAFEFYRDMWNDQMTSLIDAVAECRTGEVTPDDGGQPGNASWGFPVDMGGMVGWQTRW